MVKPVRKAEVSNFVKGLITELSPLNFTPDASKDEENFQLNVDGSRQRRLGVDFEDNHSFIPSSTPTSGINTAAVSTFKWVGVGRSSSKEFLVVQVGLELSFFDMSKENLSTKGFISTITLPTSALPSVVNSYSSIDGFLVVTNGSKDVYIVEWDGTAVSVSTSRLKVRDLWGMDDGYINENKTKRVPLSGTNDKHTYNLDNQGWGIKRRVILVTDDLTPTTDVIIDPIDQFATTYSQLPSNAERVSTGLDFQPVKKQTPNEVFLVDRFKESFGLNEQAAKGYFIIDALDRGTSRREEYLSNITEQFLPTSLVSLTPTELAEGGGIVSAVYNQSITATSTVGGTYIRGTSPSFLADTTPNGATITCDFAGRIFYAGFSGEVVEPESTTPDLSSYLLFSQLVTGKDKLINCYSEGDPTSREGNDIVETDGGFIRISGMSYPVAMAVLNNSLIVVAQNGVWSVTGGSEYGFTATNYKVEKLSGFGSFSSRSVVVVGDKIVFWGEEGIFVVAFSEMQTLVVKSISEKTIEKFYLAIPPNERESVKSYYDTQSKEIRWLYGFNKEVDGSSSVKELVFNTAIGAFSKTRFYNNIDNNYEILDYAGRSSFRTQTNEFGIVVGFDTVVVGTNTVSITEVLFNPTISPLKYLMLKRLGGSISLSFVELNNEDFKDWGEVDAKAYILTGSTTAGDSSVDKQTPYLTIHMLKTEDGVEEVDGDLVPRNQSGCLFRSQWDWANTINSGKWSSLFQAYKYKKPLFIVDANDVYDNGFEVVSSKNKLRGKGKALSIYFETEPGKDCIILGWSLSLTGNSLA